MADFGTPEKLTKSPVAEAKHHVERPALTFSKPPIAHDTARAAELKLFFATAQQENEEQEQEVGTGWESNGSNGSY